MGKKDESDDGWRSENGEYNDPAMDGRLASELRSIQDELVGRGVVMASNDGRLDVVDHETRWVSW